MSGLEMNVDFNVALIDLRHEGNTLPDILGSLVEVVNFSDGTRDLIALHHPPALASESGG